MKCRRRTQGVSRQEPVSLLLKGHHRLSDTGPAEDYQTAPERTALQGVRRIFSLWAVASCRSLVQDQVSDLPTGFASLKAKCIGSHAEASRLL